MQLVFSNKGIRSKYRHWYAEYVVFMGPRAANCVFVKVFIRVRSPLLRTEDKQNKLGPSLACWHIYLIKCELVEKVMVSSLHHGYHRTIGAHLERDVMSCTYCKVYTIQQCSTSVHHNTRSKGNIKLQQMWKL